MKTTTTEHTFPYTGEDITNINAWIDDTFPNAEAPHHDHTARIIPWGDNGECVWVSYDDVILIGVYGNQDDEDYDAHPDIMFAVSCGPDNLSITQQLVDGITDFAGDTWITDIRNEFIPSLTLPDGVTIDM